MSDDFTSTAVKALSAALPVIETVADFAFPGAASAVNLAVKLAQGIAAAEPTALALYAQIKSPTPPTQAQLDAYANDEDGAYAKLMADIKAKQAAG